MLNCKILASCTICGTKWYIGQFDYIDCPNCHGDSEKANVLDEELENCLCKKCSTVWEQRSDEKPICPTCKSN